MPNELKPCPSGREINMNTNNEIVKDLKKILQTMLYKEESQKAFTISQAIEIINSKEMESQTTKTEAYKCPHCGEWSWIRRIYD